MIESGVAPQDFWRSTPAELRLRLRAIRADHRERRARDLSLAWHSAAFYRAKRLPDLDRLLRRIADDAGEAQDWRDQKAVALQWVRAMGGAVTRGSVV